MKRENHLFISSLLRGGKRVLLKAHRRDVENAEKSVER